MPQPALTPAYRWAIFSRCLAASVGSFALTSAVSILATFALVRAGLMPRAQATATTTLASFALWAGLVMWAFTTARLRRVWLNLLLPAAILGAIAYGLAASA